MAKAQKRPTEDGEEKATKKKAKVKQDNVADGKLSVDDAKAYFTANLIKVHVPEGKDIDITPLAGFKVKGFAKKIVKYCESKFEKPTPIQACCWPIAAMPRKGPCCWPG